MIVSFLVGCVCLGLGVSLSFKGGFLSFVLGTLFYTAAAAKFAIIGRVAVDRLRGGNKEGAPPGAL